MSSTVAEFPASRYTLTEPAKKFIDQYSGILALPFLGILGFLMLWSIAASNIDTSLGKFPGPSAVWGQYQALYQVH